MDEKQYVGTSKWLLEQARTNFLVFCLLLYPPLDGKMVFSKLHRFLIALVQGVVDGKLSKRQAVSVPPQHGKSTILSVLAVAWIVGRFPDKQVAITGYSHSLTNGFSRMVRGFLEHPIYRMIFPKVSLQSDHAKVEDWQTNIGSGVKAKSVNSKLTGRRVDYLIIDDPHPGRKEAESENQREMVVQWYHGDCKTRLSPGAAVFIIATRWHPRDLIGSLTDEDYVARLKREGAESEIYHVTNLKALAEEGDDDVLGRKDGEALFPEVRDAKFLRAIRGSTPPYEWESQYQGNPTSSATDVIDTSKIEIIDEENLPTSDLIISRGWDLAVGEKRQNDFSAGALVGAVKPSKEAIAAAKADGLPEPLPWFYIMHLHHLKLGWAKLRPKIQSVAIADLANYGVAKIGMEAVSGFETAISDVRQDLLGVVTVEKRNPGRLDKTARAQPWVNLVEAGRVKMVAGDWNRRLLLEMESFPEGKHDDQIDAVSIGYEMVLKAKKLLIA